MGWVCGKCRSRGLYRDDDFSVGDFSIVCPLCGNRYYPGAGRLSAGIAPVMAGAAAKPAAATISGHFEQERTSNILTGPARSAPKKKDRERRNTVTTNKKRECENCGRVKFLVGGGHCSICYQTAKGLTGDERAAALAAIKAKIESGEVGIGKRRQGGPKRATVGASEGLPIAKKADLALRIAQLLLKEAGGEEEEVIHTAASLLKGYIAVKFT